MSLPNLVLSQAGTQSQKSGLCSVGQKSLKNVQFQLSPQNCKIWQAGKISQAKMRGVALVKAARQPRKCGPIVSSGCVSHPSASLAGRRRGCGDMSRGAVSCLRAALRFCTYKDAEEAGWGSPDSTQLQKSSLFSQLSPCKARWQWGERMDGRAAKPWRLRPLQTEPLSGRRGCALCPFPEGCLLSICLPHILSSFLFASHIIAFINRPPRSPFAPLDFRLAMGNSNYLRHKKNKIK